jgi:ribonucleoside-diphosphate reductase alpha chain
MTLSERPEVLNGYTQRLKTPCGSFYLTLNELDGKLFEVRMRIGKSGNCVRGLFEFSAILISVLLQAEISRDVIEKALGHQNESNCGNKIYYKGEEYHSCVDYVVKKILEELLNRQEIKAEEEQDNKIVDSVSMPALGDTGHPRR